MSYREPSERDSYPDDIEYCECYDGCEHCMPAQVQQLVDFMQKAMWVRS